MKVLIVEDDMPMRELIRREISALGHEVLTAVDGEDAWKLMEGGGIQIVISDWLMPRMDGLQLCERVRAARFPEYIYFIILSAHYSVQNFQEAVQKGVDDFLTKPMDAVLLRLRVHVAERILEYQRQILRLKKLMPICSYCKRVRNDKHYWQQIENYLEDQAGADVSHSICPACLQKQMQSAGLPARPAGGVGRA